MKQAQWDIDGRAVEARLCGRTCPYHPHGKWRLYIDGQQAHPSERSLAKGLGRVRRIVKRRNRA